MPRTADGIRPSRRLGFSHRDAARTPPELAEQEFLNDETVAAVERAAERLSPVPRRSAPEYAPCVADLRHPRRRHSTILTMRRSA